MKLYNFKIHRLYKLATILLVALIAFSSLNLQALSQGSLTKKSSKVTELLDINSGESKEKIRYDFVLECPQSQNLNDAEEIISLSKNSDVSDSILYSVEIDQKDAMQFEKEFAKIQDKVKNEKDPQKIREYSEKALDLYVKYKILPECFTYENLTSLIEQISIPFVKVFSQATADISKKHVSSLNPLKTQSDNSGLTVNVALPFSVLAYLNIFGAVKPFGVSYSNDRVYFTALPGVRNLTILNITINKTGWYIETESLPDHPLFPKLLESEISWEITGPIWEFLWKNSEDDYIQYKTFFGVGIYNFLHVLLGNAITFGTFYGPQLDGRTGQVKMNQPFLGNFIWVGLPFSFPLSFTLYKTYPSPWSVGLEIGVVPVLGGSALISLLYLAPQ